VVFGLLVLLATVNQAFWTWRLHRGERGVRFYAFYAALAYLVIALFALVGTKLAVRWTCDESCYGPGWTHAQDAWQWHALPLLAAAGVGAVIASTVFLAVRWYRTSLGALGVSVAVYAPSAVLFAELSG
jgi:hypothetical protein